MLIPIHVDQAVSSVFGQAFVATGFCTLATLVFTIQSRIRLVDFSHALGKSRPGLDPAELTKSF